MRAPDARRDVSNATAARGDPAAGVPASIAEIDANWLRKVLRREFSAARLRGFTPQRIGADFGFASEVHRLRLQGDRLPAAVVVKLWHNASAGGLREVQFFEHFAPAAGPFVPRCHFALGDADTGRGVLVLEDLSHAVQGDCLDLISAPRALALAEALATLHARWRQPPVRLALDWLPPAPSAERGADWHAERRASFLQRFPGTLQGPALRLLDRIETRVVIAHRRLAGSHATLLHRDLHLDNVLFDRRGGRPILLDWALVARGSPALDLALVVFELVDLRDTGAVMTHYLATLQREGGTDLDGPGFAALLGAAMLLRFATATCGVARWQAASARGEAIIAAGIDRASRAAAHWRTLDPELFGA
ncbi:MAG TPA: phosphotransferase [Rubrivivax sp.]|nr:phosphotransferase [Rubrivivax sp.]